MDFLFETPKDSHFEGARRSPNGKGNTKVASKLKTPIELKCGAFVEVGEDWIKLMLPIFTASEANGGVKKSYIRNGKKCYKGEHWTDKHRRTKLQKGTTFMMLRPYAKMFKLPCNVKLTRYAPRTLDKRDNLPMSLKYIVDAICAVITGDYRPGRADSSDEIDITYHQVVSPDYGVLVEIQNV
jgi:hypothetical protein